MNAFPPFPAANGTASPARHRHSVDSISTPANQPRMQAERNGAAPMPVGAPQRPFGAMPGAAAGTAFGPMGMPRSPPKNKNTQHVPCKFYLQGQCQAGQTCPFSHDVESTTRPAPCKYFAKGGCKFGRKCALLHITPDGTVVNRAQPFGQPFPPTQPQPSAYAPLPPGLLSIQAQGLDPRPNGELSPDYDPYQYLPRNGYDVPQIDVPYTSTSPTYGSPPQDSRLIGSSPGKGLSILEAPLPRSFDSNGISMAARNGPFAASVPSRFGVESPPSSLSRKSQFGNTALRDLHNSAFGDRGMDGVLADSSPPSGSDEPLTFPKRSLHSQRLQAPAHQIISTSLGTKLPTQSFEYSDGEDDDDADREEGLLPASLRDLIPDGKKERKTSRRREEENNTPASFLAAQRRTISTHGTAPQDSKVGTPHASSSSPSARYSSIFARSNQTSRSDGEALVSSPLRTSGFSYAAISNPTRTAAQQQHNPGDMSPTVSSPPKQASMSMLTQELQRTKFDAARSQHAAASSSSGTAVGMARSMSNGSSAGGGGGRSSLDRAMSAHSSVGRERIEEEQAQHEELFDMDEVGGGPASVGGMRPSAAGAGVGGVSSAAQAIPNGDVARRGSGAWSARLGSSPSSGESSFGAIGGHRTAK